LAWRLREPVCSSGDGAARRSNPGGGNIIDYRNGTFTSQSAPSQHGYLGSASGIIAVPGSATFWATGELTAVKGGAFLTDILRFAPH
jgi:hypothetical protein